MAKRNGFRTQKQEKRDKERLKDIIEYDRINKRNNQIREINEFFQNQIKTSPVRNPSGNEPEKKPKKEKKRPINLPPFTRVKYG